MANRKLIRPNFADYQDHSTTRPARRRSTPPEETHAESYYYLKQMTSRTPMVVVLTDGEEMCGIIEWYDKNCIKLNRSGRPNLMLLKHSIKYIYKQNDRRGTR